MKTFHRVYFGLVLALVATFTGCDSGSSTSSNNSGGTSDPNSLVGTWSRTDSAASSTTVLTFGADKSYREDVTVSNMGVSSVTRYSGTWSTTDDKLSVTFTKTEVNPNGSGWTTVQMQMPARSGKYMVAGGVLSYDGTGVAIRYVSGTSGQVPTETILPPVFSPPGGSFATSQTVTIAPQNLGALVYITRDGSTPTSSSTLVTGTVTVSETSTIKAIAIQGNKSSSISSATFTIQNGDSTNPADTAKAGNAPALVGAWAGLENGLSVVYSFGANGSLRKTTGKSFQSDLYVFYRVTATWTTSGSTLTAKWIKEETSTNLDTNWTLAGEFTPKTTTATFSTSDNKLTLIYEGGAVLLTKMNQDPYSTEVSAPLISPNGGTFTTSQTVKLSSPTEGASIYFTGDGTTPTENSILSTNGIILISSSRTIKAIAIKDGVSSPVSSATFVKQSDSSTGGNPGSVPAALVGSWTVGVEGYSQTYTYAADGTCTMVTYNSLSTNFSYMRVTGTFSATETKLVRSMKKLEKSNDGKIWTTLSDVASEETETWSVSGSILTVTAEAGGQTQFTKK